MSLVNNPLDHFIELVTARRNPSSCGSIWHWVSGQVVSIPLNSWFREAAQATWKNPQDVKRSYRHASFIRGNRIVFNIGGNKFRLIVHVNYVYGVLYIRFVGTHAQYDQVDPEHI